MKAVTNMNACSVANALKCPVCLLLYFFPTKVVAYNLNAVLYWLLEVNFISSF